MQDKKALLTGAVSQLDNLIRSALKVSQSGFESSLLAQIQQTPTKLRLCWGLVFAEKRGFEPPGAFTPLP